MALSKGNNQLSGNLIILRPITRDENKNDIAATLQAFEKVEIKTGDKTEQKWVKKDTFSQVTGNIKSVEIQEDTYEDNVKHSVKVFLQDSEASETYLLDLRMNILNRSLLNALINLPSPENVNISVYQNKKNFAASTIRQNGEMVGWLYPWDKTPKPTEILHPKTGKKLQNDYTEVDEFFLAEVEAWAKKLDIWKTPTDAKSQPKSESKSSDSEEAPSTEGSSDEVDW